ncbi:hypothetical protein MKW98_008400 [Papaver atlanticum]|uniref:CCT domain-containing protein n=1 Tax=Papaver atlanticum TaxID=357466 RepID=A0AAD4SGY5_9MAGN|nr:hypothetical protein MKW98_008400 [Papaver atlanticum]
MLQDVIHPPEHELPLENISIPISARMFEFCDHDLLSENLPNSNVSSCSNNCCYEENSSYTTNLSFTLYASDEKGMYNNNNVNSSNNCNPNDIINTMITNNNLSVIFDSQDENENNITSSMNLLSSSSNPPYPIPPMITTQKEQFDFSSLQIPQLPLTDVTNGFSPYSPDHIDPLSGSEPPLPSIFEDDCFSSLPSSYASLDSCSPSCSFIDSSVGPFFLGNFTCTTPLSTDCGSGISSSGILMGSELQQGLDFQGDNTNGGYVTDTIQRGFTPTDIQALNNDNQQLVINGCSDNITTPLTSELTSLEESSYKVGRLSVEERKEKIHRYMKKRNERNFSKKIKYACRKTLADSRPRVRGRFAKNDDFGDIVRNSCSNLEDDDEEVVGKEEDEMVNSSDIFAHISGVDSFKCSYPLQSWI